MNNKYKYIFNTSKDLISLVNQQYIYTEVNDAYCKVIKKSREEIIGKSISDIWGEEKFDNTIKKYIDDCLSGNEVQYMEKFKFGDFEKFMHVSYYPFSEDNREITHTLIFSHDITQIKEIESKLIDYEYKDPLTGLFNRKSLDIVLEMEIEKIKRTAIKKYLAVLFISLENFSTIYQTYGPNVGDVLLEKTCLRIKELLRDTDYVFRFEGKELTVIITNVSKDIDVSLVVEKILNNVTIPFRFKERDIYINCVIGISIYPEDGSDNNSIIQNSIFAMTEARKTDEKYMHYNKNLHQKSIEKINLESDIYRALNLDQFELYFQPIVDINGKIVGAEALIRWNHPETGVIGPVEFIPLAEEIGLIVAIGKWVLFSVTNKLSQWTKKHDIYVSINLSAKEFENKFLIDIVKSALKTANDLNPKYLKLEITESHSMKNPDIAINLMESLQQIGVDIFIDDFGTGQSSLSYLKKIPAKTIKIDKSFVDDIFENQEELEYITNIIKMVRDKKKNIIAEGVDKPELIKILKDSGCQYMQGFYFSKPVPESVFLSYLEKDGYLPVRK